MKYLVTNAAGFLGMHTCRHLLLRGDTVVGIDSLNHRRSALRPARLAALIQFPAFSFEHVDPAEADALEQVFDRERPDRVVCLACVEPAREGASSAAAIDSGNSALVGFSRLLDCCRDYGAGHFVYASYECVADEGGEAPAAAVPGAAWTYTEISAHAFSRRHRIPTTGLRFSPVYGPWGRPASAVFRYARAILDDGAVHLNGHDARALDLSYVDDVAEAVLRVLDRPPGQAARPEGEPAAPGADAIPSRVFEVGTGELTSAVEIAGAVARAVGRTASCPELAGADPVHHGPTEGLVEIDPADTRSLDRWIGPRNLTPIDQGVARAVDWFVQHRQTMLVG